MNTPKTNAVTKLLSDDIEYLRFKNRQLETELAETRAALKSIATQPMSNDWAREIARAILERK